MHISKPVSHSLLRKFQSSPGRLENQPQPDIRTLRSKLPPFYLPYTTFYYHTESGNPPTLHTAALILKSIDKGNEQTDQPDVPDPEAESTMSSSSRKRKLEDPAPAKYYAVRAGHTPGVYRTWAECQKNTTGFKGASCNSPPLPSYKELSH